MSTVTGHCLCGAVQVRVSGPFGALDYCHCSQCRRASGSAFATNAPVAVNDLEIICDPADAMRSFRASSGKERVFCQHCGSPIYSRRDASPESVRLRLGLFDCQLATGRRAHIWADDVAPWHTITDNAPRFAASAPDAHSSPDKGSD